jgi:hypothetical protein
MSIEDINYLKKNSIKDNIIYKIDSSSRNKSIYLNPNKYVIDFEQPFKNVYGIEILDSSIPRTMYQIDKYNNTFFIYYTVSGTNTYEQMKVEIDSRDYQLEDLIFTINAIIENNDPACSIRLNSLTIPAGESSKIIISDLTPYGGTGDASDDAFYLLLYKSSFKETFGFDEIALSGSNDYNKIDENDTNFNAIKALNPDVSDEEIINYTFKSGTGKGDWGKYSIDETYEQFQNIQTPGLINLVGERFIVVHSDIIESHFNILSRSKNSIGLGLFKLGVNGYSENRFDFSNYKPKDFHPIGKLSKIDLRFETINGLMYDFKGINHHLLLNIKFYTPIGNIDNVKYSLNANYNPNIIEYQKTQYEKDDYSDEETQELTENFKKNFLEKEKEYDYESDEDLDYINLNKNFVHPSMYNKKNNFKNNDSTDDETDEETTDSSEEEYNPEIITPYHKNYKFS